ncbi:reverse transcriptase domain-containing protein [Tanacetum coccineum]
MHTRASNFELVEPLPEPKRTLNRRIHRRNRRVPFNQRNNPPQHPRIVYPPILNIKYFCHFLNILRNYDPMDDEPMWAADSVVAPTLGFTITIPKTANEFAIKALFDRLLGEIRAFSQHENESLTDAWLRMKEMLRNCHGHNLSKAKQPTPDLDDDDIPMSREEEAKFMQTFYKNRCYNDYRDRDSNRDNWRSSEHNDYNRDNYRSNTDDKPYDLQKQFNDFMKSQQSTNAFVKETCMDLKIKLKTVAKNNQASIQNLETKFDRLADKKSRRPSGSLPSNTQPNPRAKNMLVEVGKFTFPADFVILEMEEDNKVPIILRRPFLHTADAVIRVKQKQLNLRVGTERMIFNIDSTMKHSYSNDDTCFSIDVIDEILEEDFDALLDEGSKILHSIEGTLLEEEIFAEFDEFMAMTADENSDSESDTEEPPFEKITINTDYKIKTSLEEPPTDLELKPLPDNLEYVFLEEPSFLPVIISSQLSKEKKNKLVSVLKKHKQAFAWKTTDIPGICPSFCKHKIQLLDDKKPVVQKQRRLNPNMQEVVKKEIVKLLDTGIIYPIADSPWVSPIHCVPKKGGITVVTNENDELVPTRTVTGWRVCIDYRKLNEATAKDHFPLPFMDQMLERLAGNKYFCFLDGFSGYFQIPIDPMDQEKTTFTCPFGTYAYRRMPFGLCNAPATFQRCMLAIFHDMIEESVEVFMDDFSVFGNSFDTCLNNLDKMLQRCKDAHLVLNWEKCHFMVKEGIVLGHKVSSAGLEVDKAKIDDFSKIARPLTKLLEKDTPFEFDDECQKAFELLKEKLTCAPVIVSPNWNLPFELMCDASDFVVGAVLGQKDGKNFYPIYFASKTLNLEIKDKKRTENVAADHLSRIENDEISDDSDVNDNFPK